MVAIFQSEYGSEFPLFEVEATMVEPIFKKLYSFIFDAESAGHSATEMGRNVAPAIFIVNFDKVQMQLYFSKKFPFVVIHAAWKLYTHVRRK